MPRLEQLLPEYQAILARFAATEDALAREYALQEITELGKAAITDELPSLDELRALHRQALQGLVAQWAGAADGSAERAASGRLTRGDAGELRVSFMLPLEMAQLRLHEQRWLREHGKLGAMFEQTDDLIMVLDGRGQMESVNPAFCRATGWSALEAVTRMAAIWRGPLPTRATRHLRKTLSRRDGSQLLVDWSVSPILDDDGQSLSHVFIGHDVSRQQQIELSLRENDKLRAIATLAGGIAHDFNNLLGSINGLAELCEAEAPPGSRQARNLGRIRQAGERAAELVRQMLDFSRQTPPAMQCLRMADWLPQMESLLRAALPSHHPLSVEVLDDGPVCIDLVLMQQVLMNLVRNASQAMGASSGMVRIVADRAEPGVDPDTEPDEQAGPGHLRLRVIDNGVGIAPEILHKIFEPFFTTKPVGEGTGLGLSAVHGIVSSHGGSIEVSSKPLLGTTFSLFLPLEHEGPQGRAAPGPSPEGSKSSWGGTATT